MKRIPALRDLSDDHHTGLVLALRCKRAGAPDATLSPGALWRHVQESFAAHLEPHFRIEEEHLLPGLEAIGEEALAARVLADHAALRALAGASEAEAADVPWLVAFGERLEAHIRFEEREVFEPTQHRLPAAVLEAVASACLETERSAPPVVDG